MATIINNPPAQTGQESSPLGLILGIIALLIFVWLFFAYMLPAMKNMHIGTPQIQIPVTLPNKIDVNVVQPTP